MAAPEKRPLSEAAKAASRQAAEARLQLEAHVKKLSQTLAEGCPASQQSLVEAGRWLSPSQMGAVIGDRASIANLCGYPGCGRVLPGSRARRWVLPVSALLLVEPGMPPRCTPVQVEAHTRVCVPSRRCGEAPRRVLP